MGRIGPLVIVPDWGICACVLVDGAVSHLSGRVVKCLVVSLALSMGSNILGTLSVNVQGCIPLLVENWCGVHCTVSC